MKKIFAMLVAVSMGVYPLQTLTAYSIDETPQIVVGDVEAAAGESVVVPVSLVNNSGIIGANFSVNYDTSKLKLVDAVDEKLLTNATFSTNDIGDVPFNIMFDDYRTENYTDDGVLVSLHFEVLEDAESGFTPVEVTIGEDSFVDSDVEYVSFEAVSGGVNITGSETPQIVVGSAEATAGESVALPISLVNNSGIIGANFSVSYDTSKLKLVDAVDEKLLTNATFSTNDIGDVPFNIMFDDYRTENYTEDGVLLSLYFEVLEDSESGFTPVEVTVKDDSFVDADVEYVSFEAVSGGVEISENVVTTTTTAVPTTTTTETTSTTSITSTTSTTETTVTTETTATKTESATTSTTTTAETTTAADTTTTETAVPAEPVNYSLGDVNNDGYLDAKDASLVLSYYARYSTGEVDFLSDSEMFAADVDENGYIDAFDASVIIQAYTSYCAGTFSEYQEFFDIMPNMDAPADGGYTPEEIENSPIKYALSVSKETVSLDDLEYDSVRTVSIDLSELNGQDLQWCSGGITVKYDSRLKPQFNDYGFLKVTTGEAARYLSNSVELNEETSCMFISLYSSLNSGLLGNVVKIPFVLPSDADYGDRYDVEIVYTGCEIFTNIDDDETGKLMQAYLFTRGLDSGYIKIDDYVPTTTTSTTTSTTTTTATTTSTTSTTTYYTTTSTTTITATSTTAPTTASTTSTTTETTTTSSTTTTATTSNSNSTSTSTAETTTTTSTTSTATTTEPPMTLEYQLGDVNGDGMTDASDASQILAIYALYSTGGTPTETKEQLLSADVNADDMVDASDASTVLAYYAYLSTGGTVDIETFMETNDV